MERLPQAGEFYCHFKNKLYQVKAIATHSETREKMVVYQALYGDYQVYVRPLAMFVSPVDHEKYPEVKQKYRFTKVVFGENGTYAYPEEAEGFWGPDAKKAVAAGEGQNKEQDRAQKESVNVVSNQSVREAQNVANMAETSSKTQEDSWASEATEGIAPGLMAFLDTDDFEEKYNILISLRDEITDSMIDAMSVSIDAVIEEGDLTKRYDELKSVIRTRQKYEFANRLR